MGLRMLGQDEEAANGFAVLNAVASIIAGLGAAWVGAALAQALAT
jgi:hypothetical protein